jgi:hypothetical protein
MRQKIQSNSLKFTLLKYQPIRSLIIIIIPHRDNLRVLAVSYGAERIFLAAFRVGVLIRDINLL